MQSEPATRPLRFVILGEGLQFEAWQADSIREAISSGLASPVGIVFREDAEFDTRASKWRKRWRSRKLALWRIFDRFYTRRHSRATKREDVADLLENVPTCKDRPRKVGKFGEAPSDATLAFIRGAKPDFILRFSYGILRGDVLQAAPYGIWSYHHGDPAMFRGQPPGFWEMFNGSPVAGSILQVLSDDLDAGLILHQGIFKTHPSSYAKMRDTLYFGSSPWVRRTCAAIQANGWPSSIRPGSTQGSVHKQPTNWTMLRFCLKIVAAFFSSQIRYRFHRQDWNCAIVDAPIEVVAGLSGQKQQRQALQDALWMSPAKTEFYADPFGHVEPDEGSIRLFFELFDWTEGLGRIGTSTYREGRFSATETSLSTGTHLSYPFVIENRNYPSIVPENAAANEVSRYEIDHDGIAFKKEIIFATSALIDTTFVNFSDKVWAFALIDSEVSNTNLYIFHAEKLDGPWHEHALNPVKTDIRSARPAGTPFFVDGRLYRPAQDCATHYGSAITINEILKLTETEFEEVPAARVEPLPDSGYSNGLHTISRVGNHTLVDGAKMSKAMRGRGS